jgi:hypothetical protein
LSNSMLPRACKVGNI